MWAYTAPKKKLPSYTCTNEPGVAVPVIVGWVSSVRLPLVTAPVTAPTLSFTLVMVAVGNCTVDLTVALMARLSIHADEAVMVPMSPKNENL